MPFPEAAALDRDRRRAAAARIRLLKDISPWPQLDWFNTAPCDRHAPSLSITCRRCGVRPRSHQRVGAAWMYLGLPGLLSDSVGTGKTATALLLLAMCKQAGELGPHNRAVIVCKAAAVSDPWAGELARLTPGLRVLVADGTRQQRLHAYMSNWEVCVISDRTFSGAHGRRHSRDGDVEYLSQLPVGILVYDDIDPMRNYRTEASIAVCRLAAQCTRVHGLHATPLQKKLSELWCFLQPVGGRDALGSLERLESRYVSQRRRTIVTADPSDRRGRRRVTRTVYADNGITSDPALVAEFRALIAPLVLRRTAADLNDVELPQVQPCPEFLDLSPRQRARYEELRAGTLRRLGEQDRQVTQAEAGAAFTRGRQICSGLAALDGPAGDDSVKLDWAMRAVTGDLAAEKAVCFVFFKANVAALSARLDRAGVGHVLMWGAETGQRERARRLQRFREDPACRVLVGTTTIEASLNLQVARHLIAVDTIPNAARMEQLVGRVRRVGSPYPTVFFHHLLARNTLEDAFLPMLRREGEMADTVWDESTSLFAAFTPRQILQMVATGRAA